MKNIALALSGGGFRAAAFSLGSLSYLNSISFDGKPLLENSYFIIIIYKLDSSYR